MQRRKTAHKRILPTAGDLCCRYLLRFQSDHPNRQSDLPQEFTKFGWSGSDGSEAPSTCLKRSGNGILPTAAPAHQPPGLFQRRRGRGHSQLISRHAPALEALKNWLIAWILTPPVLTLQFRDPTLQFYRTRMLHPHAHTHTHTHFAFWCIRSLSQTKIWVIDLFWTSIQNDVFEQLTRTCFFFRTCNFKWCS